MIKRICPQCGTEFYTYPSAIRKGGGTYCCRKCSNLAKLRQVEVKCAYCGKTKSMKQSEASSYKLHFCDKTCESNYRRTHPTKKRLLNEIVIQDNFATVKIPYKGEVYSCLISLEDVDKVKKFTWRLQVDKRHPNLCPYVVTRTRTGRLFIHRLVTGYDGFDDVDHINGNRLDNRRENLRIIDHQLNTLNKKGVGVWYNKRDNNWIASISIEGKTHNLGYYRTEEEARARREFVNKLIMDGKFEEVKNLKCEKLRNKEIKNKSGELYIRITGKKYQVRIKKSGFYFYKIFDNIEDAIKYRDECVNIINSN